MKTIAWFTFLLVIGCAVTASAQFDGRWGGWGTWGGGWGGGYRHASTAAEGAARGMADVIRSQGAANLMNSEAAKNIEDARKKYIENRLQRTNTYFEMKQVNKEARAQLRGPAPTQEQLIRVSQAKLPDRMTTTDLDPVTGAISWPTVLRADNYKTYRSKLEELYNERAKNGYLSPDQYLQVKQVSNAMMTELQKNVDSYPTSASIDARKFIQSISYEANMEPS
jgi:hypothetical protein